MNPWLIGLPKISKKCGICIQTLRNWMRIYDMPIKKIGGVWTSTEDDLDEWVRLFREKSRGHQERGAVGK